MKENVDINISILEAMQGAASIIGPDGEIIYSNKAWRNKTNNEIIGAITESNNYFIQLEKAVKKGNDHALKLIFGLREVLDGEKNTFEMSSFTLLKSEQSWNRVCISSFNDGSNQALIIFDDISKNVNLLQARRESKELYLQHFKNSLQGIILSSPDGRIFDANPAACNILGYAREELIEGGRDLIVPKNDPLHNKAFKIRKRTSKFEGEKTYVHKDGYNITVEISSVLYRNSKGNIRSINTFRDKSKEKKTEQSLEDEKLFNEAAINSIPGIFFVINKKYELAKWNSAFTASLRYPKKDLTNRNVIDFVTDPYKKSTQSAIKDAFKNGTGNIMTEVKTKLNEVQTHQIYVNRFVRNGLEYLVGTGTDITHLLEAEAEKEKSIEMMSQLFNNSPLAMILIDPDNNIKRANKGFTKLFEYTQEEVIGKKPKDLITSTDQLQEIEDINCMAFSGTVTNIESTRRTKSGKELSVLINTVPVKNNGEIIDVYGIYVDMTDQKSLEQQLHTSLREKEVLFAEIHHRVKNNLAVIAGLLDLQIEDEVSQSVKKKLNEVRSRIFSIAKINESLYGKNDVVSIRFDEYLQTVTESLPQKDIEQHKHTEVELDTTPVSLNLNQAVSAGLIFNELMNTILDGKKDIDRLKIDLTEQNGNIEIAIEGNGIDVEQLDPKNEISNFQNQLIDILLSQIKAKIHMSNGGAKKVTIRFKKSDMSGPSSSIKNSEELQKVRFRKHS